MSHTEQQSRVESHRSSNMLCTFKCVSQLYKTFQNAISTQNQSFVVI